MLPAYIIAGDTCRPCITWPNFLSQQVHEYLRSKLCSLYENDCIFDKFECCWSGNDSAIMTGSYNNFFRVFDRTTKRDLTLEAARDIAKPKTLLKPRKVSMNLRALVFYIIIRILLHARVTLAQSPNIILILVFARAIAAGLHRWQAQEGWD